MKLSLMIINLLTDIFLDEHFRPKENPDIAKYEEVLKLAHDAGYNAIDMTNMEFSFGAEKVKELMDKYELACGSVILFENYTCIDKDAQEKVKEQTYRTIEAAEVIGCHTMMLVAAGAQPNLSRVELQKGLAENLSMATEYASKHGITICIEDFPSTEVPMCSIADVGYLLENVPGLKLTYDTANMLVEGEKEQEYYDKFRDKIGYCHLKDVRIATPNDVIGDTFRDGRKMITTYHGEGIIDLKSVISWLYRDGYENHMSVEYAFDGKKDEILDVLVAERVYLENIIMGL